MFCPLAGQLIADLLCDGSIISFSEVVELGNQTYDVDHKTLKRIINQISNSEMARTHDIDFDELSSFLAMPVRKEGAPKVKDFYRAVGFEKYTAIDISNRYGSLLMDLNYDLHEKYSFKQEFGLVTNIGVSEHIFNQAAFFKNAHHLAKVGGIIFCMLPFYGYINHGFYCYQPRFFEDLSNSNGYDLLSLFLAERDRVLLNVQNPNEINSFFSSYIHALPSNPRGNVFVVAIMRLKKKEQFVFPLQGRYLNDLQESDMKASYSIQRSREIQRPTMGFFPESLSRESVGLVNFILRIKTKMVVLKLLTSLMRFVLKYT